MLSSAKTVSSNTKNCRERKNRICSLGLAYGLTKPSFRDDTLFICLCPLYWNGANECADRRELRDRLETDESERHWNVVGISLTDHLDTMCSPRVLNARPFNYHSILCWIYLAILPTFIFRLPSGEFYDQLLLTCENSSTSDIDKWPISLIVFTRVFYTWESNEEDIGSFPLTMYDFLPTRAFNNRLSSARTDLPLRTVSFHNEEWSYSTDCSGRGPST